MNKNKELELATNVLKSFSVYTNLKELFALEVNKNHLLTFDAIRVISLSWVILGHTIIFNLLLTCKSF